MVSAKKPAPHPSGVPLPEERAGGAGLKASNSHLGFRLRSFPLLDLRRYAWQWPVFPNLKMWRNPFLSGIKARKNTRLFFSIPSLQRERFPPTTEVLSNFIPAPPPTEAALWELGSVRCLPSQRATEIVTHKVLVVPLRG